MLANRNTSITTVLLMLTIITTTLLPGCSCKSKETEDGLTEQEIEQLDTACQELSAVRESDDYKNQDKDAQKNTMMKALFEQSEKGNIVAESIRLDEKKNIITYRYSNGVLGGEKIGGYDDKLSNTPKRSWIIQKDEIFQGITGEKRADAIILYAMNTPDRQCFYDKCIDLAEEWRLSGVTTNFDNTVTLDDMTNLKGYEFVYFEMHGNYLTYDEFFYNTQIAYSFDGSIPTVQLEENYSKSMMQKYSDDFKKGNIGVLNGCFFVTPGFFADHYEPGSLSGSIIYFGCCEIMGQDDEYPDIWDKVLKSLSVQFFVGYHNSVYTAYDGCLVEIFMRNVLAGKTCEEALSEAESKIGSNDREWEISESDDKTYDATHNPAYPMMGCNPGAKMQWENADPSVVQPTTEVTETTVPTETPTPTPSPTPTPEPTATPTPKPTPRPDSKLAISKNNFPDKEFRRFLKNEVDKNKDGSLSKKEISKVKKMDFYDESGQPDGGGNGPYVYDIADLTGIERFANLESINIPFNNYLKHLDMTKNPKLKKVRFFDILPVKSAVIRIGQTIEYDSISAVGEYEQGNKNPYYKTKNKDIVSISTPKGSRACKFAGIKAGTAKITGDYQSNSWKIKVTGSSVRPVPTATPTPTPKPVVKVTNAVNKKYKNTECEGTHQYKVPKITITGKNMKSINNKILKDIKKFGTDYEVGYSYYVDQKIVSIFVHINESHDSSPIGYSKVYNISVASGKLLNDSDVVKMWGSTDKQFFSIVKTVYKKVGNQFGILSYLLDNNPISYKYIDPYIGKNGHLCFTCFMQGIPNEDHAVKVDTKTKKIRDTFDKDF